MKNLYIKLLKLNEALTPIKKDMDNPFFHSKYADINKVISEIRPKLAELKMVVLQPLTSFPDGKPGLKTIIIDTESGESFGDNEIYPLIEMADIQKAGGVITYSRRYALLSSLMLETEDDDGEGVVRPQTKTYSQPVAQSYQTKPLPTTSGNKTCPKCGAPMIIAKSTGKEYCSAKCWLKPVEELPTIEAEEVNVDNIPF